MQVYPERMTTKEAAEYLRMSKYTLREKASLGEIPSAKIGRKYLFRKATLDSWLEEQERNSSFFK